MRLLGFVLLLLIIANVVVAQDEKIYVSTEVNATVYSTDISSAKAKTLEFLAQSKVNIQNQSETKNSLYVSFNSSDADYTAFENLLPKLGYVSSKKVESTNNAQAVAGIQLEIKYLNEKRDSYKAIICKLDSSSENYLSFWRECKEIEAAIFEKEKEMLAYSRKENYYVITLDLNEEQTTPDQSKIAFVNMPGVEYGYLLIKSPLAGFSASKYQGVFLKYLFTKGKSYATAGAFKKVTNTDSLALSDLFILSFGQDFYTRHLGRGANRFLNLYSGYSVGGIYATDDIRKKTIFYVAPSIGIELFKNKYILFDTKASYMIPFAFNREMRGINLQTSFNFVF